MRGAYCFSPLLGEVVHGKRCRRWLCACVCCEGKFVINEEQALQSTLTRSLAPVLGLRGITSSVSNFTVIHCRK